MFKNVAASSKAKRSRGKQTAINIVSDKQSSMHFSTHTPTQKTSHAKSTIITIHTISMCAKSYNTNQ